MKNCSKCLKPSTDFSQNASWCRPCHRAYAKTQRLAEPEKARQRDRDAYHADPVAAAAKKRLWREANPDKLLNGHLKRKFKITLDEYKAMLAAQGGVCAVCSKAPGEERLHVDHDHATGKVRGLLHGTCNRALGLLGEDLDAVHGVIRYLQQHKKVS